MVDTFTEPTLDLPSSTDSSSVTPATQEPFKQRRGRGGRVFFWLVVLLGLIAAAWYFALNPMTVVGSPDVIDPFNIKQRIFSERVTYYLREPRVGDGVIFSNPSQGNAPPGWIGIIVKIVDVDNILTYHLISIKTQQTPWIVTRDKIQSRIYSPVVSQEHFLSAQAVYQSLATPTPTDSSTIPSDQPTDDTSDPKTFVNNLGLPISFQYPSNLSVASVNYAASQGATHVFIDTKPISIPEAWDGPLTPIEIQYFYPDTQNYASYETRVARIKEGLTPESVKEEKLSAVEGVIISGIVAPGYMEGTKMVTAIVNTPKGPATFQYFGYASNESYKPSEETFRSIVNSVQIL